MIFESKLVFLLFVSFIAQLMLFYNLIAINFAINLAINFAINFAIDFAIDFAVT